MAIVLRHRGHAMSLAGEATTVAFVTSSYVDHSNTLILITATACAFGVAALLSVITRYVPELQYIYYPELRKKK